MARMYRTSTSGRTSRGVSMKSSAQNAETRLTLTLVCIVVMFLLLVAPSELINLYFYVVYSIIIIIIIINENISVAFSPKTARTRNTQKRRHVR